MIFITNFFSVALGYFSFAVSKSFFIAFWNAGFISFNVAVVRALKLMGVREKNEFEDELELDDAWVDVRDELEDVCV
ncbi:MAG: hypothetical protein V4501_07520 [Pseudomonadota bacterium]